MVTLGVPSAWLVPLACYLALANLLALGLFVVRRVDAGSGEWTGAEMKALFVAMMGGWLGAFCGRRLFGRPDEPQGFGRYLALSILVLPVLLCLPMAITAAPGRAGKAYVAYLTWYVDGQGASEDSTGLTSSLDNPSIAAISAASGQAVQAVEGATTTTAKEVILPKRFGPTAKQRGGKSTVGKFVSVGKN